MTTLVLTIIALILLVWLLLTPFKALISKFFPMIASGFLLVGLYKVLKSIFRFSLKWVFIPIACVVFLIYVGNLKSGNFTTKSEVRAATKQQIVQIVDTLFTGFKQAYQELTKLEVNIKINSNNYNDNSSYNNSSYNDVSYNDLSHKSALVRDSGIYSPELFNSDIEAELASLPPLSPEQRAAEFHKDMLELQKEERVVVENPSKAEIKIDSLGNVSHLKNQSLPQIQSYQVLTKSEINEINKHLSSNRLNPNSTYYLDIDTLSLSYTDKRLIILYEQFIYDELGNQVATSSSADSVPVDIPENVIYNFLIKYLGYSPELAQEYTEAFYQVPEITFSIIKSMKDTLSSISSKTNLQLQNIPF